METHALMEFQRLSEQLQMFQQYLELLEQQLGEVAAAQRSVEEILDIKQGTEMFVPLASGVYVQGTLGSTTTLLLNIGQNTLVEKSPSDALALLSAQFADLARIQEQMHAQFGALYQQYVQLQLQLEGS